MKHVMKKNSGGGDCDPRPKASENETTVGWSSYIALHIKEAKNRIRVLHDLKFRRRIVLRLESISPVDNRLNWQRPKYYNCVYCLYILHALNKTQFIVHT